MEKNPYTMAKLGLEPRENLRSNRDCSFYVKYFFFFLSIIQFLIILGLVLFMIYGNTQAGTDDHMKRLSARVENCNVDIGNLKKEKEALKRQLNTSQVEARGLRATLNRYNSSLKACNDEKAKTKLECQGASNLYNMLVDCTVSLHLLNFTQKVKFEAMEEQLKILTLKYQLGQETSSRDIKALQQSLETAEKEKNTCQLNRIREKAQDQKFHELESKIMEELRPLQLQLEATVNRALPSSTISCFNQELIHQTRQTCLNLPNELNANLGRFAGQMDQRVSVVAQENGLLQREKEACSLDLQERDRRLRVQQQHAAHELEEHKATFESKTKKMDAERQKLVGEKESLQQQLEQVKQACKTLPPMVPVNRFPGLPGTGSWRGPGSFGNPGASAVNPNLFANPSFGRAGSPPQSAAGAVLGAFENLGIFRNPLAVGTSGGAQGTGTGSAHGIGGAHGIPPKPDRTRLEENKRFAMENIKPQNQSTVNHVGQPRG